MLDCVTRMALAAGKAKFCADAPAVLGAMRALQSTAMDPDDPLAHTLLHCWGRLAETLGEDFAPCLELVVPVLLKILSTQTDITIVDEDGQDREEGVESVTLSLKGLGEKRICIRTSEIEEKTISGAVLLQVLQAAPLPMFAALEQVVSAAVPLLKFVYVEDLREDAARVCLPALIGLRYRELHTLSCLI